MNSKSTIAIFIMALTFLVFLEGCFLLPNNCDDVIHREFTDAEKNFFPYEVGDTVYFINESDGTEYFLHCTYKRNVLRDTSYYPDYYCDNGGYSTISSLNSIHTVTNYQSGNFSPLFIKLKHSTYTYDGDHSSLEISIKYSLTQDFDLYIDPQAGKILSEHIDSNQQAVFLEGVKINGKEYKDVYRIFNKSKSLFPPNPDSPPSLDTLYFNKTKGILKLVSNHINLEWTLK